MLQQRSKQFGRDTQVIQVDDLIGSDVERLLGLRDIREDHIFRNARLHQLHDFLQGRRNLQVLRHFRRLDQLGRSRIAVLGFWRQ